jgi:hypothetical protein
VTAPSVGTRHHLSPWQRGIQIGLIAVGLAGAAPTVAHPFDPGFAYSVAGLTFAAVGWLLTERKPENGIGWCFLGVWFLVGAFSLAAVGQHHAVSTNTYDTWWAWASGWVVGWMWGPLLLLATTMPLLLFPDGMVGRLSRWVAWTGVAATVVSVAAEMLSPELAYFRSNDQVDPYLRANNPLSPGFLAGAGNADGWAVRNIAILVLCATAVVAAGHLVVRGRRSSGVERLQFRWVVFGAAVAAVLISLTILPAFRDSGLLGTFTWALALVALPITTAIAILRFHLYDIDRVLSRTAAYAIVTGLAVAVYAVIVTTITRLLPTSSALPVAIATLAAAAVFQPLLRVVRNVVDHRFNRARYDAQRTVNAFGERLRSQADLVVVVDDLRTVVEQTLDPHRAAVWMREP